MNKDSSNGPFKYTKVLIEHSKESPLTILLIKPTPSLNNPEIVLERPDILHHQCVINGITCHIIEPPPLDALLKAPNSNAAHLEEIQTQISATNYIWFATSLNAPTLSANDQNVIKWLSHVLGEQAWSSALLILMHNQTALPWNCASMIKERLAVVRAELSRYCGWDIARSITAVPIACLDDLLLDERNPWPIYNDRSSLRRQAVAVPWQVSSPDIKAVQAPRMNALTLCYLWSGPAGALGLCLWGPAGFCLGLAGNALIWTLIGWLRGTRNA